MDQTLPQELVEKHGLHQEAPSVPEHELAEATYILIRHGYSQFNHLSTLCRDEFGEESPEWTKLISDPAYFDPDLHALGVLQAETM